jgi:hypothetical protein
MPTQQRSQARRRLWPTLEEQLEHAKVQPGGKLDRLIRDSKHFYMLSPAEAHEGLPFLPWLRVYWRKSHPELDFSGPPVGYPLILTSGLARVSESISGIRLNRAH